MKQKSLVLVFIAIAISLSVVRVHAQDDLIRQAVTDVEDKWPVPASVPGVRVTKASFQDQSLTISRIINLQASNTETKNERGRFLSQLMSSKELVQQLAYNMETAHPGFLEQMASTHTSLKLELGILHLTTKYSQTLSPEELVQLKSTLPTNIEVSNFLYEIKQRNAYLQSRKEGQIFHGISIEKDKCIMDFIADNQMISIMKSAGKKTSKNVVVQSLYESSGSENTLFDLDMRVAKMAGVKKVVWAMNGSSEKVKLTFSEEETEKLFFVDEKEYNIFEKSFLGKIEASMPLLINDHISLAGIEERPDAITLKLTCTESFSNFPKTHPEKSDSLYASLLQNDRLNSIAYLSAFESSTSKSKDLKLWMIGCNHQTEYTFSHHELVRQLCLEKEDANSSRTHLISICNNLPANEKDEETLQIQPGIDPQLESINTDQMLLGKNKISRLRVDMKKYLSNPVFEKFCMRLFFNDSTSTTVKNALDSYSARLGTVSPSQFLREDVSYRFMTNQGISRSGYFYCYLLHYKIEEATSIRSKERCIIFDVTRGKILTLDDVLSPAVANYIKGKAGNAFVNLSMAKPDVLSIQYKQEGTYRKLYFSLTRNKDLINPYFRVLTAMTSNKTTNGGEVLKAKEVIADEKPSADQVKVFDVVEQMPEFPGGQAALLKWISDNIKYPEVAEDNGIQGRVVCTFVVERDGSITDVQVARSIDPSLDKEAVRVLKKMPRWNPGKQKGQPVRVKYTVPVTFKMQ